MAGHLLYTHHRWTTAGPGARSHRSLSSRYDRVSQRSSLLHIAFIETRHTSTPAARDASLLHREPASTVETLGGGATTIAAAPRRLCPHRPSGPDPKR